MIIKTYEAKNGKKYNLCHNENLGYFVQQASIQGEVQYINTDKEKCIAWIESQV